MTVKFEEGFTYSDWEYKEMRIKNKYCFQTWGKNYVEKTIEQRRVRNVIAPDGGIVATEEIWAPLPEVNSYGKTDHFPGPFRIPYKSPGFYMP